MTEENNENTNMPAFGDVLGGGMFGPVEQTIGVDQYQANVEQTKSVTEGNKSFIALNESRAALRNAAVGAVNLAMLGAVPFWGMYVVKKYRDWLG